MSHFDSLSQIYFSELFNHQSNVNSECIFCSVPDKWPHLGKASADHNAKILKIERNGQVVAGEDRNPPSSSPVQGCVGVGTGTYPSGH